MPRDVVARSAIAPTLPGGAHWHGGKEVVEAMDHVQRSTACDAAPPRLLHHACGTRAGRLGSPLRSTADLALVHVSCSRLLQPRSHPACCTPTHAIPTPIAPHMLQMRPHLHGAWQTSHSLTYPATDCYTHAAGPACYARQPPSLKHRAYPTRAGNVISPPRFMADLALCLVSLPLPPGQAARVHQAGRARARAGNDQRWLRPLLVADAAHLGLKRRRLCLWAGASGAFEGSQSSLHVRVATRRGRRRRTQACRWVPALG